MNKLDIAKLAVSVVVGSGVSKIVGGIVKNNTNPEKITDTVSIIAGTWVLGGIAADVSKKYTDAKIDDAVTWWNENVQPKLKK